MFLYLDPLSSQSSIFYREIGQEISDKLYTAVAVALAYIYKIDRGEFASEPEIIVPEDMQFNENGELMKETNVLNRTSLGQIISTAVFYGVAFLIFLKGMEFLEADKLVHAYISLLVLL